MEELRGASVTTMVRRAVVIAAEILEAGRELSLTALEEEVMDEFSVSDQDWEDLDMSFRIWESLDKKRMLDDD